MLRFFLFLVTISMVIGACNKLPDHANYLPKDALIVAEVNTQNISKKLAWDLLTDTKLWGKLIKSRKSVEDSTQLDFIKNMEQAGVDQLNTFYAYLKNTTENDACFVVLIPLKDAHKFERFLKENFEGVIIHEKKTRKEAQLSENMQAGWTNNMLMVVSIQETEQYINNLDVNYDIAPIDKDEVLSEQLDIAFNITKDHSLVNDKRFVGFEKTKHDIGFWINIDALMSNYGNKNLALMSGGVSLSNSMWRNSAFSTAINFEKGKIVSEMTMFSSDELTEINKIYAPQPIDQDLIQRLPTDGLDYVIAYNMSTQGTLKTIEKMGLLGIINLYLNEYKITFEEVLSSLTGDMAFSMNNFKQTQEKFLFDSSDATSEIINYHNTFDLLFALKINDTKAFQKVLNMASQMQMIEQIKPNFYKMKGSADSSVILVNQQYAVFANYHHLANQYLNGTYTNKTPLAIKENIFKHPFGAYFDYQNWAKNMSALMTTTTSDSLTYVASLNTFESIVFNGGELKSDNTYKYQMSINFQNKKESSLKQLIEFAEKLQHADSMKESQRIEDEEQYL